LIEKNFGARAGAASEFIQLQHSSLESVKEKAVKYTVRVRRPDERAR